MTEQEGTALEARATQAEARVAELEAENERLREDNARLLEFEQQMATRLIERDLGPGTRAEIKQEGEVVQVRATAAEFARELGRLMAEAMEEVGGTNYVEWQCAHEKLGSLTLTLQRVEGETPGQQLEEARAEVERLRSLVERLAVNIDFGWDTVQLDEIKAEHGSHAAWLIKDVRAALGAGSREEKR